jgi:PAS domain S-box-containing protein
MVRNLQTAFPFFEEKEILSSPLLTPTFSREFLDSVIRGDSSCESASFVRNLIDRDSDLIFVKDRESRFAIANRTVAKVYGCSPEELTGRTDADFNDNLQEVEQFAADDHFVIQHRSERLIPFEILSCKDGARKVLSTIKVPLVDSAGNVTHLLGIATDITVEYELRLLKKAFATHSRNQLIPAQKKKTVLVVDDDEAVREVTRELLEGAGYEVHVAKDGIEGMRTFLQYEDSLSLLIVDLIMPHADGEEMVNQVRRIAPRVPVILCTGYYDGQKHSFTEHIFTKPYDPRKLLAYAEHLILG